MADDPLAAAPPVGSLMPFDSDAAELDATARGDWSFNTSAGLTADEFTAYVKTYDFGSAPPDFICIHHTADPCTVYTGGGNQVWDQGEAGLNIDQIKAGRQAKVLNLKSYYEKTLGWTRGPHLFIDDRFIWLFTPMSLVGVHAKWGNSFNRAGTLHYSIGIEVVGNYEHKQWPPAVAQLVGHAVAALKQRLGTFELRYMYADPNSKPGMTVDNNGNLEFAPTRSG